MNENIDVNVKTLKPFTKLLMTIGELPTSYLMSMTYYEQIIWFTKYLQEQVIPAVNTNASAVEELQGIVEDLQNYVNNYFDNLDVQEEINKKLDEMAEDGSLTNLISSYLTPYITELNEDYDNLVTSVNQTLATQNQKIEDVKDGSPAGVYSTLSDLQTADPSHDEIYIVTANNKWYYYNTSLSSWTAGGDYLTGGTDKTLTESNVAGDSKAIGDYLNNINFDKLIPLFTPLSDGYYNNSLNIVSSSGYKCSKIDISKFVNSEILINAYCTGNAKIIITDLNETTLQNYTTSGYGVNNWLRLIIPKNSKYLYLSNDTSQVTDLKVFINKNNDSNEIINVGKKTVIEKNYSIYEYLKQNNLSNYNNPVVVLENSQIGNNGYLKIKVNSRKNNSPLIVYKLDNEYQILDYYQCNLVSGDNEILTPLKFTSSNILGFLFSEDTTSYLNIDISANYYKSDVRYLMYKIGDTFDTSEFSSTTYHFYYDYELINIENDEYDYLKDLENRVYTNLKTSNSDFTLTNSTITENGLSTTNYTKTSYNKFNQTDIAKVITQFKYTSDGEFGLALGNLLGYVDTDNSLIKLCYPYQDDNVIPSVISQASITFTFTNNHFYTLTLVKNAMDYTFTITDVSTQEQATTKVRHANTGFGKPQIVTFTGSTLFNLFSYNIPFYNKADVLFLGDSTTEGVDVNNLKGRWCYQLKTKYFTNKDNIKKCVIAGVGGNKTSHAYNRLVNLINNGYSFKYVIAYLGLNDLRQDNVNDYKTNITNLYNYCLTNNMIPVIVIPQILSDHQESCTEARDYILANGYSCIRFDMISNMDMLHPNDSFQDDMYKMAVKDLDTLI